MASNAFLFTNQGGRHHNEDSADYVLGQTGELFAVADGLGGIKGGEAASQCVISGLMEDYRSAGNPDWCQWMGEEISRLNQKVLTLQEQNHGRMKSTLTMVVRQGQDLYWSSVGDTRLYYVADGTITQISRDHSVTFKKYLSGQITRNQMNFDEDRSSLLRAVGDPQRCQPDCAVLSGAAKPGAALLLCTDGFWEYLFDEEILLDRLKSDSPRQWTQSMLLRIMERLTPGTDNLTALTVFL